VRPPSRIIGAQFLDLVDGGARHDLIVRVHHGLEHDGVARVHVQHRRLGVVEPAPLGGVHGGRQHVGLAGKTLGIEDAQLLLIGRRRRNERHLRGRRGRLLGGDVERRQYQRRTGAEHGVDVSAHRVV
jgi:hypothetical protein